MANGAALSVWTYDPHGKSGLLYIMILLPSQNKVTSMTFLSGSSIDGLQKVQQSNLDARHTGWVTCDLTGSLDGSKVVRIELKGPDSHLRIRQVKALGGNRGETLSAGKMVSIQVFIDTMDV